MERVWFVCLFLCSICRMIVTQPTSQEYAPYFGTYISKVQQNDLLEALRLHTDSFTTFIKNIPEHKADYAYAEGKWTVKEVLLHIIDAERIFAYRALRFARNDKTALPGFEENYYVPFSNAGVRSLSSILEEFIAVRNATTTLFNSFDEAAYMRSGVASNNTMSVRALGYIILGHAEHHKLVLEERYL